MTTSGTYGWTPQFDDIVADAYERIGIDPQGLTGRHVVSALRSVNFLFAQWGNISPPWKIDTLDYPAILDATTVLTTAGTMAVLNATLKRDTAETPMIQISREDYQDIPDKTSVGGRPDRFYADLIAAQPTIYIWPKFENTTDIFRYTRLRHIQTATGLAQDADVLQGWLNALVAGLAVFLAEKYAPERLQEKTQLAGIALEGARQGSRDRSDLFIGPSKRRR